MLLPLLSFLTACDAGTDSAGSFDCVALALPDSTGEADPCDVAACEACVDTCAGDCFTLETYPPDYACPSGGSWSVYDVCPNWQAPTTPYVIEAESLGCGDGTAEPGILAEAAGAGRITVTDTEAVTGCCPEDVSVGVSLSGSTLTLTYDLVNDRCECACELDLSYTIVEVPAGTWTLSAGPYAHTITVVVP